MISQVFHSTGVYLLSHVVFFCVSMKLSPLQFTNDMAANYNTIIPIIVFVSSHTSVHFRHIEWSYPFNIFQKMFSDIIRSQQTSFHLNHAVRSEFTSPITEERSISDTIRCTYVYSKSSEP
jgi:hypothetical protein